MRHHAGLLVVLCLLAVLYVNAVPNYQACVQDAAKGLPYCDVTLSHEARVKDLMDRLTLQERIDLISPNPTLDNCNMMIQGVDRIGLPEHMWLVEVNTGVASTCMAVGKCSTTFVGEEGLGATFNRTAWFAKGDVISTEMRALSNANWYRGQGSPYKIGLTGFGPNINMARDPRFGRNSELPGEDPLLTGEYAAHYVRGMQQVDSKGYKKMIAYLKHYAAYSVETNRGHDTYNISTFDFFDTYLPQYRLAFLKGGASGVMCSYAGENGYPSCANNWLLNEVMRKEWNQPDAVVMTDCGAVNNLRGAPVNAPSDEHAAAFTINNGTDLEAGSGIWGAHMATAIEQGLTTEAAVNASVRRTTLQLMAAGRFDSPELVSWTNIGTDSILSAAHNQTSYEIAAQSFVLLKNELSALPLKAGSKIAVVGPQAVAQFGLLSDYFGDQVCFGGDYWCMTTIGQAVATANVGGTTLVAKGVDVNSDDQSGIQAAIDAVNNSDIVVLALGIDKTIEQEGHDRVSITLPGLQESFAQTILGLGKPVVLVLNNGGALAIDTLIAAPRAIVEAFNPAMQAQALADSLFGLVNRWGKLPITMYPADYVNQQPMTNFDMSKAPGRTYRYYTGTPLFSFGQGLSLSTFDHTCVQQPNSFSFSCAITNAGPLDGDEVLLVFHSVGSDIRAKVTHPVPIKQLVDFDRVTIPHGQQASLAFDFSKDDFALTNADGQQVVYPGQHTLVFSRGNGVDATFTFTI